MDKLPWKVKSAAIIKSLEGSLVHQGKVRDTYQIGYGDEWGCLLAATDRLSIFDFVLPALVPMKGEVFTALTHFWFNTVLKDFPHHLLPSMTGPFRNYAFDIALLNSDVPKARCLAARKLKVMPFELILRHYIGGSVYKKYVETSMAGGQLLPAGLQKWSKLNCPICTPSTKSEEGHDVNITLQDFLKATGERGRRLKC